MLYFSFGSKSAIENGETKLRLLPLKDEVKEKRKNGQKKKHVVS
jgi:hypothetical protein